MILFQNGKFDNQVALNPAGVELKTFFINILKDNQLLKSMVSINVTSQGRFDDADKRLNSPHYKNLAIDFVVYPISLMPYVWSMINRYLKGNVYLSSVPDNIHLHYDVDPSMHSNYKRLETEQTPITMAVPMIDDGLYNKINQIYGPQDKALMFEQNSFLKFAFGVSQKKNDEVSSGIGRFFSVLYSILNFLFCRK